MLLGEIKDSVTIAKAVYITDKNGHEYFVLQVVGGNVIFVQSFTRLFSRIAQKYKENGLEGSQIVVMKNHGGISFLEVV